MNNLSSHLDQIANMDDNELAWKEINGVLSSLTAEHKASTGGRRFALRSTYKGDVSLNQLIACVESIAQKTGNLKGHEQANKALTQLVIKDFEANAVVTKNPETAWKRVWAQRLGNLFSGSKQKRLEKLYETVLQTDTTTDAQVQRVLLALRHIEATNRGFEPIIKVIKDILRDSNLSTQHDVAINEAVHQLDTEEKAMLRCFLWDSILLRRNTSLFQALESAFELSEFLRSVDERGAQHATIPHVTICEPLYMEARKDNPIGTFVTEHPKYPRLLEIEKKEEPTSAEEQEKGDIVRAMTQDYRVAMASAITEKLKSYSGDISKIKHHDLLKISLNTLASTYFELKMHRDIDHVMLQRGGQPTGEKGFILQDALTKALLDVPTEDLLQENAKDLVSQRARQILSDDNREMGLDEDYDGQDPGSIIASPEAFEGFSRVMISLRKATSELPTDIPASVLRSTLTRSSIGKRAKEIFEQDTGKQYTRKQSPAHRMNDHCWNWFIDQVIAQRTESNANS